MSLDPAQEAALQNLQNDLDAPNATNPPKSKKEKDPITAATNFGWGGRGFAGQISEAEIYLRNVCKQPDAVAVLLNILKKSSTTPAGQLYALSGLRLKSPPDYQDAVAAKDYTQKHDKVTVYMGCMHRPRQFSDIFKEIHKGDCDDYLAKNLNK